jgi:hypothetical protein
VRYTQVTPGEAEAAERGADFCHGGQAMTAGAEHRWTRVLFNAGEPTNSLSMWGIEGPARRGILPNDDGAFAWFNGDEEGAGLVLRRATSAVHFVVLAG